MVMVSVRGLAVGFAATEYVTTAFAEPPPPDVMVIHGALAVAVHAQPAPAVTATWPTPPLAVEGWAEGAIEYVQPPPALPLAPCVTVTVWPATVIAPVLDPAPGFGAAE
jgi:hypothetical protein